MSKQLQTPTKPSDEVISIITVAVTQKEISEGKHDVHLLQKLLEGESHSLMADDNRFLVRRPFRPRLQQLSDSCAEQRHCCRAVDVARCAVRTSAAMIVTPRDRAAPDDVTQ